MGALAVSLTSPIWKVSTAFGKDAGAGPAGARRFIGVFSANGTIASEFFPGCSSLLATSPNSCGPAVTAGTDTPLTTASLGRILQPLPAHVSKMVVLKGVDMISTVSDQLGTTTTKPGGPHMKGPGAMLTGGSLLTGSFQGAGGPAGNADRISVDQYIAGRIGTTTAVPVARVRRPRHRRGSSELHLVPRRQPAERPHLRSDADVQRRCSPTAASRRPSFRA